LFIFLCIMQDIFCQFVYSNFIVKIKKLGERCGDKHFGASLPFKIKD